MPEIRSNDTAAGSAPREGQRAGTPRPKRSAHQPAAAQEPTGSPGLGDEIDRMRMVIRMVCELIDAGRPVPELLNIFDSLGKLCTRLATLLKAERTLSREADTSLAFSQALKEISDELGLS